MVNGYTVTVSDVLDRQNETITRIESQPPKTQAETVEAGFVLLLGEAGQPKSASGNACVRLCNFVEQCSKSKSEDLRNWAFARDVTERLFNFYVEWNESEQHRSMKLVLDLIVQLRKSNPDQQAVAATERDLLETLISIIVGTSTKPVAKSAIKTIDHFLTKGIFTVDDVRDTFIACRPQADSRDEGGVWRQFFAEMLQWTRIHFVCSAAGRCLVLIYRKLRSRGPNSPVRVEMLNRWILDFLVGNPSLLEMIKNYVLLPLFKGDRAEALSYLRMVSDQEDIGGNTSLDMDMAMILQLTALEAGKRVGLVEEPSLSSERRSTHGEASVVLDEKILTSVLSHPSREVRSLAYSLLVTSPSTTRVYSPTALSLLQKHLGTYFADPDAKFRFEVMAQSRDMFKRVRGSISVLKRSIPRARAKEQKRQIAGETVDQPNVYYHTSLVSLINVPEAELVQCLDYHQKFLRWYIEFLCSELTPTSAYQRRVGSLKALSFILRMEEQPNKAWETPDDQELFYDLFDSTWVRALFDMIMDPFDDIRDMAASALRSILSNERYRCFTMKNGFRDGSSCDELQQLLDRANELSRRTARADHADGAARAAQLVYKFLDSSDKRSSFLSLLTSQLEDKLSVAERDLGAAVLEAPVHGDFASLRYIWQIASGAKLGADELESARDIQDRLVECCGRIWNAVRGILCDDSPEGHLPQELEEVDGINTKDILSYSFRSICEASYLMRVIALTIRNRSKQGYVSPSPGSFSRIGNMSFHQLSTLRHRGAFTAVSTTFAMCCQQSKHLDDDDDINSDSLLNTWYKGTTEAIFSQVSTTRRSAGIPSLMTGVLSANGPSPAFEQVMEELIGIASMEAPVRETDATNLPQVHAYNCLKDIFKNSLLSSMGKKSEKYLTRCIELAATGLKSETWAIRNCSLILLKSLIDSLFGSHESKSMIEAGWDGKANRIPYHRYPTLPDVLVNLLKSGVQMMSPTATNSAGAESVFPSLDIVRRAGPPDRLRGDLQVHISKYLASPVWHVREMAARTLCSCLLHENWFGIIDELLHSALQDRTRNALNHIHGVLLSLKFVFDRLSEVAPEWLTANVADLTTLLKETSIDTQYANCPDILAAYIEVVNQVSEFRLRHQTSCSMIDVATPETCGSALLKIQVAIYRTFAAYESSTPVQALRDIYLTGGLGSDTMSTALELLPKLWPASSTPDAVVSELCNFYIDLCIGITMTEPKVVGLESLADMLDQGLARKKFDIVHQSRLAALWAALPLGPVSPSLSYAILKISGCVTAILLHHGLIPAGGLKAWGLMLADAGLDDKGFDTRFAAAEALNTFFQVAGASCTQDEHLSLLLALYDALNDDDDEVRDMAAAAVKGMLGLPLTSLEAANRLLDWLSATYKGSAEFKVIVAARLTGARGTGSSALPAWKSAKAQVDAALEVDDTLFAVEEQNLFVDEVREAKRWAKVLTSLDWDPSDATLADLDAWLQAGIARLEALLDQHDGPLGWASNPQVFAVCSLVLVGSTALASCGHATPQLRDGIMRVEQQSMHSGKDKCVSGLLVQPLRDARVYLA